MLPNPESARGSVRARIRRAAGIACVALALAALVVPADARRSSSSHHASGTSHRTYHRATSHRSTYAPGAKRDSHGRIQRSEAAKREFMKKTGYPHGRPGYVVDHIKPLSRGGADSPSNMQWQTKEEAKAKDKWERGRAPSTPRSHRRK
jgi:hypothetical protein